VLSARTTEKGDEGKGESKRVQSSHAVVECEDKGRGGRLVQKNGANSKGRVEDARWTWEYR